MSLAPGEGLLGRWLCNGLFKEVSMCLSSKHKQGGSSLVPFMTTFLGANSLLETGISHSQKHHPQ